MEQKKKNNKKILIIILIIVISIVCVGLIIYLNKESLNLVGNSKVNAPQLIEGMTPVKWNGNQWIETTTDDEEGYNYSKKQWANVKLADGSMFVWIPRYAYKITNGYHGEGLDYSRQSSLTDSTKQGGTIEIAFLNGISNVTFNNKTIQIQIAKMIMWYTQPLNLEMKNCKEYGLLNMRQVEQIAQIHQ